MHLPQTMTENSGAGVISENSGRNSWGLRGRQQIGGHRLDLTLIAGEEQKNFQRARVQCKCIAAKPSSFRRDSLCKPSFYVPTADRDVMRSSTNRWSPLLSGDRLLYLTAIPWISTLSVDARRPVDCETPKSVLSLTQKSIFKHLYEASDFVVLGTASQEVPIVYRYLAHTLHMAPSFPS